MWEASLMTINENCPCKSECARHGNCELCRENHKNKGTKTYCEKMKEDEEMLITTTVLNTIL